MRITARPSKTFFYRMFERDMKYSDGRELGADIASDNMKNWPYFRTHRYLAVDCRPEVLNEIPCGADPERIETKVADIRSLDIPDSSIDFLVSTHTLSHIEPGERFAVLCSFVRAISVGGDLLFNIPFTGDVLEASVDSLLERNFAEVRKTRYRNALSQAYERMAMTSNGMLTFEDQGRSRDRRAMMVISLFLSLFEGMRFLQRKGNMFYYFARRRDDDLIQRT